MIIEIARALRKYMSKAAYDAYVAMAPVRDKIDREVYDILHGIKPAVVKDDEQ